MEVLETVHKICEIACFARQNGLLALDEVAAEQEDMFLKSCLLLAWEGESPEKLEEYALIWMLADNTKGKRLLEMAVIADGVVQIRKGENTDMIFRRFGAWFGSKFAEKFESALQEIRFLSRDFIEGNAAGIASIQAVELHLPSLCEEVAAELNQEFLCEPGTV